MKAKDIMTADHIWVCGDTADCRQVAQLMAQHDIGAIPVLDNRGRLEGIITDRDICCRCVAEGRSFETPVRDLMSRNVRSCSSEASLQEIETLMREHQIRRIPVIDDTEKVIGMISLSNLVSALEGRREEHELKSVLEAVCTSEVRV
jgi:CBS domain-containing protein